MKRTIVALGLMLGSSLALAHDDWGHRSEVSYAAHNLASESEHFHEIIHWLTGYSHLAADAHSLANDAEHFHQVVEGGAPFFHVINDYYRLSSSFQHLRSAFYYAHQIQRDPHVEYDWRDVEGAFNQLSQAIRWGGGLIPPTNEPGQNTDAQDTVAITK